MTSDEAVLQPLIFFAWGLPLLSFLVLLIIRTTFAWLAPILSSLLMVAATVCSVLLFVSVWNEPPIIFNLQWLSIFGETAAGQIKADNLSVLMAMVVTIISTLVHIYSIGYMTNSQGLVRYFALLGFFTFSMLGIVFANDLLFTFIFWELVGFSSYLLIGHWRERPEAGEAATKAFIFNRIGDAGFVIALSLLWAHAGTLGIGSLYNTTIDEPWKTWISIGLFCGIMGKSAQFPLSTWLPDAMEGPTPISALIHAATMVAAGVFLLVKIHFLFSPTTLSVVGFVGSITALWGAWGALSSFDIKKILAYSTVSQLGFMMIGLTTRHFTGSLVHLLAHAFFKACLFLCAGAVIHFLERARELSHRHDFDVQDIRNMGGLRQRLPVIFFAFIVAGASLAGVPLLSGFVSKDLVLNELYTQRGQTAGLIFLAVAFLTSFLTVLYTFRLFYFVFLGENRRSEVVAFANDESIPTILTAPIVLLAFCSTWLVLSINPMHYSGWLSEGWISHAGESTGFTFFSATWIAFACLVAWLTFRRRSNMNAPVFFLTPDPLFRRSITKPVRALATVSEQIDRRWIDRAIHFTVYTQVVIAFIVAWFDRVLLDGIVDTTARLTGSVGSIVRTMVRGKIQSYILWAMALLIIFILWILLQ